MSGDSDQIVSRVRGIFADILSRSPESIGSGTEIDNTPGWDSLNHLSLVAALEQEFDIELEVEEIETMNSFDQVIRLVSEKS